MVPPVAAPQAANAQPAQRRLRRAWYVRLSADQPGRFERTLAVPSASSGLQTAAIQPDHAGDRDHPSRDAARVGAVTGLRADRFAPGQSGRYGSDAHILHWFGAFSHDLLEPGSILFLAIAPGRRSADGDHAAGLDVHQFHYQPRRIPL